VSKGETERERERVRKEKRAQRVLYDITAQGRDAFHCDKLLAGIQSAM